MKEKIIIVFLATIIGLVLTAGIYYIYQTTQTPAIKRENTTLAANTVPTPSIEEETNDILSISKPNDEEIFDRRTIQVKGRTTPNSIVVVSSGQEDVVAASNDQGEFELSLEIATGVNTIITRVIGENGDAAFDERVVTYTTEEI